MRFISIFAVLFFFQAKLQADNSANGVQLHWSCEKEQRGQLPPNKDIVAYYNDEGELKFKPDIFKLSFRLFDIFIPHGTADLAGCVKNFTNQLSSAISGYQSNCQGRSDKLCTKNAVEVAGDTKKAIRSSKFYRKYQSSLASAEEDLGPINIPVVALPLRVTIPASDPQKNSLPVNTPELATVLSVRPEVSAIASGDTILAFNPPANPQHSLAQLIPVSSEEVDREKRDIQSFIVNHPELGHYSDYVWRCTGATGGQNVGTSYCKPLQAKYEKLMRQLRELVNRLPPGELRKPVEEDKVANTITCLLPRENQHAFSGIEDFLRVANQPDMCEELKNSESKLVNYDNHSFLLKRKENGDYEAVVNINFELQGSESTPEAMLQRVRTCLSSITPSMLGPDKKSHLHISVKTPDEVERELPIGSRPQMKTIHVVNKKFFEGTGVAGNTENFREDFDCPGITHEFLHHLGMCDEYQDHREQIDPASNKSWKDVYSCRILPTYPSLMNNPWDAFSRGTKTKKLCECQLEGCKTLMNATDNNSENLRSIMNTPTASDLFGMDNLKYCKSTALPLTNILRNPSKAFDFLSQNDGNISFEWRNVIFIGKTATYYRSKMECHCPPGNTSCAQAFTSGIANYQVSSEAARCPAYTQEVQNLDPSTLPENNGAFNGKLLIVKQPTLPSLIAPNQFGKVLYGNCPTGPSGEYDYCDKYAREAIGSPICNTKRPDATGNQCLGIQQ
jgi:hypothetical protein